MSENEIDLIKAGQKKMDILLALLKEKGRLRAEDRHFQASVSFFTAMESKVPSVTDTQCRERMQQAILTADAFMEEYVASREKPSDESAKDGMININGLQFGDPRIDEKPSDGPLSEQMIKTERTREAGRQPFD